MFTLLSLDLAALKNWFRRGQMMAKLAVALAFLLIVTIIVVAEYTFSLNLFTFIAPTIRSRGLIHQYLISSTLIALAALAFVFTLIRICGQFYAANYKFVKPLKLADAEMFLYYFSRVLFENFLLMASFGLPIFIGLATAANRSVFVWRALYGLGALAIMVTSISTIIAFLLMRWQPHGRVSRLITLLTVAMTFWGLRMLVLPPASFTLRDTRDIPHFEAVLSSLPIMQTGVINWYPRFILRGVPEAGWRFSVFAGVWAILALIVGGLLHRQAWQQALETPLVAGGIATHHRSLFPWIWKPALANAHSQALLFTRSGSQLWYAVTLMSLIGILIFLLHVSANVKTAAPGAVAIRQIVGFVGLQFLFLTAWIRFIYPIFSLELRMAWLNASARHGLKAVFGGVTLWSTILVASSLLLVEGLSVATGGRFISQQYGGLFAVTNFLVGMSTMLFSAVEPNTAETDPTVISTSAGGLLATIVGVALIIASAWIITQLPQLTFFTIGSYIGLSAVTISVSRRYFLKNFSPS